MTENEAIEELKYDCNELGKSIPCDTSWGNSFENAYAMAIKALEEVQQYRAIGNLEECRKSVEIYKAMIERNITAENMEEYMKFEDECVRKGFSFKSLLEAREKHTAKKAMHNKTMNVYFCPVCERKANYMHSLYCSGCGQLLDWSDVE